jgi:hypothetical protein
MPEAKLRVPQIGSTRMTRRSRPRRPLLADHRDAEGALEGGADRVLDGEIGRRHQIARRFHVDVVRALPPVRHLQGRRDRLDRDLGLGPKAVNRPHHARAYSTSEVWTRNPSDS